MPFTEDFLHYVWKFRLFDRTHLHTTGGDVLEVYSAGLHNTHAGPDFHNSRIRIGETTWAGNTELHISSSDWQRHNHSADNAYHNVILHVVYQDDEPVVTTDGRRIPTLELKGRIPADLFSRYESLLSGNKAIIPCEASIAGVDTLTMNTWLTRILIERLENRSEAVIAALHKNRGDWEETFYQFMAANFGFKTNALPFELMAKGLPQNILAKHKNNSVQIEALIFGQAGFLNDDFTDDYPRSLKREYDFLRHKLKLTPIDKHLWKFLRMRPRNFPTIRLAQFAALVVRSNHLFSKILEIRDVKALKELFTGIEINTYWDDHYQFDKQAGLSVKNLGQASADALLINTVALFLFSYGRQMQQQYYISRGLKLLENIPNENNNITADFVNLGLKISTALESQAYIELKNNYCDKRKCLHCGVGIKILKPA